MTRIVEVPASFDDRSFDQFAASYSAGPDDGRQLFDARGAQWASPYGLVGMLTAAQATIEAGREKPLFTVPVSEEVRDYWAKTGFFRHAAELFEIHGKVPRRKAAEHDAHLLDVTPVRIAEDVHGIVEKIQEGASRLLTGELGLEPKATMGFAVALSEACQNIVEHAGTTGWVAVHSYNFRRRLGRKVVVIAVSDPGIGFRRSLESAQAKLYGDRWGDAAALEAGLLKGVSRFRDPGRGQGLAGIKRYLQRWDGKISVRSGTARLSALPTTWDDEPPVSDKLPDFPGTQVQIVIPAQRAGTS